VINVTFSFIGTLIANYFPNFKNMIKTTQFTKAIFIFLTTLFSNSFTAQTFIKVNTDIFPKAEKNQKKVVIDVPYSPTDANKKIEIFCWKRYETDKCNQYSLSEVCEERSERLGI
jgi:ecotin